MRLIDSDALKEYCMRASKSDDDFRRVSLATLASVIDAQPTVYDADKVVERLEKEKNPNYREDGSLMGERAAIEIDKAIEIVKAGGNIELSKHSKSQGN